MPIPVRSLTAGLLAAVAPLTLAFGQTVDMFPNTPPHLAVIVDRGVVGAPPSIDSNYASGTRVSYHYKAAPGNKNVLVLLDGCPAPASGTITIRSGHVLMVSADSEIALTPPEQGLLTLALALRKTDDPAHEQAYRAAVDRFIASVGPDSAAPRLDIISAMADLATRQSRPVPRDPRCDTGRASASP